MKDGYPSLKDHLLSIPETQHSSTRKPAEHSTTQCSALKVEDREKLTDNLEQREETLLETLKTLKGKHKQMKVIVSKDLLRTPEEHQNATDVLITVSSSRKSSEAESYTH